MIEQPVDTTSVPPVIAQLGVYAAIAWRLLHDWWPLPDGNFAYEPCWIPLIPPGDDDPGARDFARPCEHITIPEIELILFLRNANTGVTIVETEED